MVWKGMTFPRKIQFAISYTYLHFLISPILVVYFLFQRSRRAATSRILFDSVSYMDGCFTNFLQNTHFPYKTSGKRIFWRKFATKPHSLITILELGEIFKTKWKLKDLVKIYLTVLNLSECINWGAK